MTTFRDTAQRIAPPWLRGYWGSRLLYSLAAPFDALFDSAVRAVGVRIPGNDPEADMLTGADRRIPHGPSETDTQYARRLTTWRAAHASKGTNFSVLRQLSGYLRDSSGVSLNVRLVTNRGDWFQITSGGLEEYLINGSTWDGSDWDAHPELWARAWVIVDVGLRYSRATTWHIGLDSESYSVGSNMPTPICAGIKVIVSDWGAAHAYHVCTILSFVDSPTLAPSGWARLGDRDGLFNFFGG